ncbi:endolytic transglycosylase MltG [bacterium]|nr:endolytic transglycosylase MltG [bacterium]MBU4561062.1 endolytic transglycosylase MltG [bacterium]MCG2678121.1 endolytic transglycosylase MltG [bacterium]
MNLKNTDIAIVILIILGIVIYQLYIPLDSKSPQIKVIEISKGMNAKGIAHLLKEEGLIKNGLAFRVLAKVKGVEDRLQAGEYELSSSMNLSRILSRIKKGETLAHSFTIPEGYNIRQIAQILEEKGLAEKERFIELTKDSKLISQFDIPAKSLEGYLFPETYRVSKGMNEEEIIELMVSQFNKAVSEEDRKGAQELGFTFHQIIILASIVEKETSAPEERALISAVFHNRLKAKRPLQADPTVIYALGEAFDGDLKKEHLRVDSPYNTYRYRGLPPGPIGNPGRKAIQAALYPADVNYLYFVSRNDGTHAFSSSLEEHNRAVWKYQKRQ